MANVCKMTPDAPNGKPSKLFKALQAQLGDRELAKTAWGFTQTELFKSEFGDIEHDENGEPTYDALNQVLELDRLVKEAQKDKKLAMDTGVLSKDGKPVEYDTATSALGRANEFNDSAKSKVAITVEARNGKYISEVVDRGPLEMALADRNKVRGELNAALIRLVQRVGFDVSFMEDSTYPGVFNPLNAEDNAAALRVAVAVSNNEAGAEALPEEVSHFVVAGLKDDVLRKRIDALFTDDVVRSVLGDDYWTYKEKYKNGKMLLSDRLREEAEGKILAELLKGRNPVISTDNANETLTVNADEYTDEFRDLQRESLALPEEKVSEYQRGDIDEDGVHTDDFKRTLGSIYERLLARGIANGVGSRSLTAEKYGASFDFYKVNGSLFHDIFEINQKYLVNGELVDLHDNYDNCKCFLSNDGLCGFAIEPDGNLISVFSLNPSDRRGFLYAIKDFVREQGATHLDAFASDQQDLAKIYGKTLGFKIASRMDFNPAYDEKGIGEKHNNPDVVFMVNSPGEVAQKHFDMESYDEAKSHQESQIRRRTTDTTSQAPLLNRLWNKAKGMFRKIKGEDIDAAVVNAQNALKPIAEMMKDGSIDTLLDPELIKQHETMYDLTEQSEKIASIVQDGETLLSKKLYILQQTNTEQDTLELRNTIKNVRDDLDNQRYALACYSIMTSIGKDVSRLMREAESLGHVYNNSTNLNLISNEAGIVSQMSMAVQAYTPYLETLSMLPILVDKGQIDMDKAWATQISENANKFLSSLNVLKNDLRQMRFSVLRQLVSLYYGDMGAKPENFTENDRTKFEPVDMILSQANRDISWWDTNLFSAGDSRNPLINVVHKIVVSQQAKRNNRINKYTAKMQEAEARLQKAGYDSKHIYQYDENGKPTGFFAAPVDMARYEKERTAFIESLDRENMDYYAVQKAIRQWDDDHTEEVQVGDPVDALGTRRTEWMPKREIYGISNFQQGWSQEQKDYYNAVISMKAEMDSYLPVSMQCLYLAPQVRKSVTQMFDKDGRGAINTVLSNWKQQFSVTDDNQEYGKDIYTEGKDGKKHILLGFDGKPIKRVPVYFVHKLEHMEDLCTDGTRAMFNYISMAINYSEMGKLANAMRLLQEHVETEYEVIQTDAGKPMVDMFRSLGVNYEREYVKTGSGTNVVKALNEYIDRQFFNDTKEKMGNIKTPVSEMTVSKDALFNIFMRITSVSRMGLNVLSGITNVLQGKTQIVSEGLSGRYFNLKDAAWASKEYAKLLPAYMGSFNSVDRHDKMYLLINQFNSGEDYFRDMRDKDFNKNAFKRVLGKGNIYFLNTMGEHNLHTEGMLMVLKHEKVRRLSNPKEEVSLYDVIKEVHDKDGWHLELDSDIEFVDKNRAFLQQFRFGDGPAIVKASDRDMLFENLAQYINKINADMHGGYSEAEKGNINRKAIGRLLLQFRQWMFGMYNKLYSGSYYDAVMGVQREGGYVSMWKFLTGTLHDWKNMSIKQAIEKNRLTPEEMQNVKVAMSTAGMFVCLCLLASLTMGWKDEDDRNKRMLAYAIKRLQMETGALVPSTAFGKNVFTILQSPAAGMRTFETLLSVFDVSGLWEEIGAGRYKGWTRTEKALFTMTPIYNIQKLIDMKDYNYMFNIFK